MIKKTILVLIIGMFAMSTTSCGNSNNKLSQNSVPEFNEADLQTKHSESLTTKNNKVEVSLDVTVNENNGQPIFTVNTNLPDETDLMLSLRGEDYTGQTHAIVNGGIATSEQFSNKGKALKGKYVLSVSMSNPKLQSDNVRAIIGEYGEHMSGKYVQASDTDNTAYISGDFNFSFKSSKKKAKKDKSESDTNNVEKFATEIVVSSKMLLERFVSNYDIPLATQLWTLTDFDENGAVMATANITEKTSGILEKAIIVLTPNIEDDKMVGGTPHYVSVGSTVYGNDGYCDEFLANLEEALGSQ